MIKTIEELTIKLRKAGKKLRKAAKRVDKIKRLIAISYNTKDIPTDELYHVDWMAIPTGYDNVYSSGGDIWYAGKDKPRIDNSKLFDASLYHHDPAAILLQRDVIPVVKDRYRRYHQDHHNLKMLVREK